MKNIRVGDVVKVIEDTLFATDDEDYDPDSDLFGESSEIQYGMVGTVIAVSEEEYLNICVEFDSNVGGHRGPIGVDGLDGHCWWVHEDVLKVISTKAPLDKKEAVKHRSKILQDKFNERKRNASTVSVQNDFGKLKKTLPFPKATVTFRETSPF